VLNAKVAAFKGGVFDLAIAWNCWFMVGVGWVRPMAAAAEKHVR
jgi:hypothetical protein